MSDRARQFLEDQEILLSNDKLREIRDRLRAAMQAGLARDGQTVRMIPAYVPPCRGDAEREVIALDAGGTNVRAALVRLRPGQEPEVVDVHKAALPGANGDAVDRETFFDRLAELVDQLPWQGRPIGFVFSYPTRILPDRDGILLRWTKEVRASGVEGTRVGEGLADALERRDGTRPTNITVLNDTVAALAAASTRVSGTGGAIGLIVGTGTNMAYFEQAEAITKLGEGADGPAQQAINMESGNFDGVPRTSYDAALDEACGDPGHQAMEKMVSGRYLGEVARRVVRGAVGKGVLSGDVGRAVSEPWSLLAADLSALVETPARLQGVLTAVPEAEVATLREVVGAVVTRSARVVAAGLAAVLDHLGLAAAPVAIVAEGTLFWQMPGYGAIVETTLDTLAPPLGSDPRFLVLHIDDANLVGAAVAAVS